MAEPPRPRGVLVVAVDGMLADSLAARLNALLAGVDAVGLLQQTATPQRELMAGRSWSEAVRLLPGAPPDETLLDLAALAAEREWTQAMNAAWPTVDVDALQRCRAAVASGWRLILRADSTRRSAAAFFSFLEEETGAVRCISGDDPGVLSVHNMTIVASQYAGIIAASSAPGNGCFVESAPVRLRLGAAVSKYLTAGWPE